MNNLVYLVPLLPLAGFLINGLGRNFLSKSLVSLIGCGVILGSFVISLVLFFDVKSGHNTLANAFEFIQVGKLSIPFAFQIDPLSSLFLLIITGVGFLIHVYSTAYMKEEAEPHFARYFSYLNLFVFFDAAVGHGCELCNHVYRLGRRRALFLSANRLLVQEYGIQQRREEGFRDEPDQ
jgi:NADH-quinone oxidoreductase subunit L